MSWTPLEESLWAVTAKPGRSLPSLTESASSDVAVIGGGYCGLSTALHLAKRGVSVIVLEAQEPGFGGSGRNNEHCVPEWLWQTPDAIVDHFGPERGERLALLFRPVTTDVKGERRFIATIARRLDSLGAITRGQRDSQTAMGSGDQALFRESDNLESLYAKAALRRFYIALWRGNIPGWSLDRFEDATGLKLVHEGNLKEDLPPMPRFLNRLLALPIDEQNQLFAELEDRIAANIEQAMEAGAYEVGVETVRADSIAIAGREALYEHPGTGAVTEPGRDRAARQAGTARCRYRARNRRPRTGTRQ